MVENKEERIKHKFTKDRYVSARGGSSHFLNLHCAKCDTFIALYQKDGPGRLLRSYIDRFFEPESLARLKQVATRKDQLPNLKCPKCEVLIGTPMVYEQERRLAFRLIHGTFVKKKSDGVYARISVQK